MFPYSPIIALFVCCHITSYLPTFCWLYLRTTRTVFNPSYISNKHHCSWLHSGKLLFIRHFSTIGVPKITCQWQNDQHPSDSSGKLYTNRRQKPHSNLQPAEVMRLASSCLSFLPLPPRPGLAQDPYLMCKWWNMCMYVNYVHDIHHVQHIMLSCYILFAYHVILCL